MDEVGPKGGGKRVLLAQRPVGDIKELRSFG